MKIELKGRSSTTFFFNLLAHENVDVEDDGNVTVDVPVPSTPFYSPGQEAELAYNRLHASSTEMRPLEEQLESSPPLKSYLNSDMLHEAIDLSLGF